MPSSQPFPSPLLLVDGYNIIGAWPELKALRDRNLLADARDRLVETLIDYSATQQFHAWVVFDAYERRSPACSEPQTDWLATHYTAFAQTADSYIEKICADFSQQPRVAGRRLRVVTSDRAQQLTVTGYGAEWQSALQLAAEVQSAQHKTRQAQNASKRKQRGRSLFDSLDPKARDRLAQLRQGRT